MADGVLRIKVRDVVYDLAIDDVNGQEWQAIKHATGMGSGDCFLAAQRGDIEAIAALIWTHRKRTERKLNFSDVLNPLTFRDLDILGDEDEETVAPPSSEPDAG